MVLPGFMVSSIVAIQEFSSEFRFNFYYEPVGDGDVHFEAGLELNPYRDQHLVLAAVDLRVLGKVLGKVDGHHRLRSPRGVKAQAHVLVVLVSHYVGARGKDHPLRIVLCSKLVVSRRAGHIVLEVGARRYIAHLKAGACPGPGSLVRRDANDLDQKVIVRAGEADNLRLLLRLGEVGLHIVEVGGVVEGVVAVHRLAREALLVGEDHFSVVAGLKAVHLGVMSVADADDTVGALAQRREGRRALGNLLIWDNN